MRKLLKYLSFSLLFCVIANSNLFAQWCTTPNFIPTGGGKQTQSVLESKNGVTLPNTGTLRILLVFFELNYDVGSDPSPSSPQWAAHTIPTWATPQNFLLDANTPIGQTQALLTEYFREASSGQFNVLGDFLLSPTNGGIFTIDYSDYITGLTAPSPGLFGMLNDIVNIEMTGNFVTGSGLNNVTNFDNWTMTSPGVSKITPSTDSPHKYDHVMYIFRNAAGLSGGGQASSHGFGTSRLVNFDADSFSFFGVDHPSGQLPIAIARHEFSHLLYGDNRFHCGGGGYGAGPTFDNYWITIEGGWSNLGLYNSSLQTWNAWDRQRMDWKTPGNLNNPSARNAGNTGEVNGDLDATNPGQVGIYTLRDFVTTGDAIRIKLPFINPATEYQEWLWIENHNGTAMNGSPFDQWQFQGFGCVNPAVYGLYMYMQIDKDNRQGASFDDVFGANAGFSDYLRPITAEGRFDKEVLTPPVSNPCHFWIGDYPFIRSKPNALTGDGDQDWVANNWVPGDGILIGGDRISPYMENVVGNNVSGLLVLGDSRQAFRYAGNKKLGIGTNPSSASLMNMVGDNSPLYLTTLGIKDLQKVYLNGISIEILNQAVTGEIQVQIKFDDINVDNDTRWCANEIILNPITTPSGYSLNILSGKTLTIDQGTTATRMDNPQTINGKEVFASPTIMRCLPNTYVHLESNSNLIVDNNSTLELNSNSKLEISSGAILRVKRGGKLILGSNSTIIVQNGGRVIIENDGYVDYFQNSIIKLNGLNSVFEIDGTLNIQNGATFTFSSNSSQHGYLLFANTSLIPSRNIIAGTNCNINLTGASQNLKVLQINQETFYAPPSIVNFTISTGKVELAPKARLLADGLTTNIALTNAVFTSTTPGVSNGHRGVHLYGQPNVSINNCVFEYGSTGIYGLLTYGGFPLNINTSTFKGNTNGVLVFDKGCNLYGCNFINNDLGFIGGMMSSNSVCNDCTFSGSSGIGCYWNSQGSSFTITNCNANHNKTGIKVLGAPLYINCSSITNNYKGIEVIEGGTLTMNNQSKVNVTQNNYSIKLWNANNLILTTGKNDITPSILNNQRDISGRVINGSLIPIETSNKWNNSGTLTANDYLLLDNIGNSVILSDPTPLFSTLACGIVDPCPVPPCNIIEPCRIAKCVEQELDPVNFCPDCRSINTTSFPNKKINEAIFKAIEQIKSIKDLQNFKKGLNMFLQIQTASIPNPNKNESYLLNFNYIKLLETLGFAIESKQIVSSKTLAPEVQSILNIQDNYINLANKQNDNLRKYLYNLDKAQTYRIASKRDLSLVVLKNMLSWVDNDQLNEVNNLICKISIENKALIGNIDLGTLEGLMIQCNGFNNFRFATYEKNISLPEGEQEASILFFPNPVTDIINIRTNIENAHIYLFDNTGRSIEDKKIHFDSAIDMSTYSKGIYIVKIENVNSSEYWFRKLILQ